MIYHARIKLEDIDFLNDVINGWKVILTTCCQRECAMMDCQREIPLGYIKKKSEGLHGTIKEKGSSLISSKWE